MHTLVAETFRVTGVVQGVGFRPFVYRLANELGLDGEVGNSAADVFISVAGAPCDLDRFEQRLWSEQPPLARIDAIQRNSANAMISAGFRIVESRVEAGPRTLVSPDTAVCDDCLNEMRNPDNRRFGHPFITCTNCGPRYTIIRDLPYDRPATTMAGFPMCAACAAEYADPTDRRYHAQPIACHDCGPTLTYQPVTVSDTCPTPGAQAPRLSPSCSLALTTAASGHSNNVSDRAIEPVERAAQVLADGGIVAIKGLGGFHLACDATNADAVAELRRRKHRPDKPFAVMVPTIEAAGQLAHISREEAELLRSPARPVVLSPARPGTPVVDDVAPRNPLIGLMLPYTPVHHLLLGLGTGPLVMTSANLHGEPIIHSDDDVHRLEPLVDGILSHDRPIEVPCDDSVVRIVDGELLPIRRARGYAPLPVPMPTATHEVMAVGGELKNTFTVVADGRAWVSPHIGDMENLATLNAFERSSERLTEFYECSPEVVAHDAHPGYATTRWAQEQYVTRRSVQHHHAHVAAVMAEHQLAPETTVLGFAFDGTGYGSDGSIWGGEVLLANALGFDRVAHLAPVQLPGGDGAVRFPSRMALAHLHAAGIEWSEDLPVVQSLTAQETKLLRAQLDRGIGCTPTSSMGRLFDAVAALIGLRHEISYEAQAAIDLELCATGSVGSRRYNFAFDGEVFDAAPVLQGIVADLRAGIAAAPIAAGFHRAVASLIEVVAADVLIDQPVVLTGGCFQNALLLRLCRQRLNGLDVLTHRVVPPNDGGLSLGQAFIVAHQPLPEKGN